MSEPAAGGPLADAPPSAWDRFWFSPGSLRRVGQIRSGLAILTLLYFASYWSDIGFWFADGGVADREVFARLISETDSASTARWRLSPLFWTGSPLIMRAYLAAGIGLAAVVAAGRGGRIATALLWLAFLGLANRASFLAGLAELPLAFGLAYCAFVPTPRSRDRANDWTAGLSLRLLQTHTTLWLITVLLTQLAGSAWWNGNAALALVAPTDARLFDLGGLLSRPTLGNSLTHLLVLLPLLGLPLAWHRPTNRWGVGLLIGWWVLLGMLSAQLLYAATLLVLISSLRWNFFPGGYRGS